MTSKIDWLQRPGTIASVIIIMVLLLGSDGRLSSADDVLDHWVYLPLIAKEFEPAIVLPTGTPTATPTSIPPTAAATSTPGPTPTPMETRITTLLAQADTSIDSDCSDCTWPGATYACVGSIEYFYNMSVMRGLVEFDMSGFLSETIVIDAQLRLYNWKTSAPVRSMLLTTRRLTKLWDEDEATWELMGEGFGEAFGSKVVEGYTAGWVSIDVTALVQQWVSGYVPNYGVGLTGAETLPENNKCFETRERGLGWEPQLVVQWTGPSLPTPTATPTATPTPTATATPTGTPESMWWVQNDTGGTLCYEVEGTGIGEKCWGAGMHYYGAFPSGTYWEYALAGCGTIYAPYYFPPGTWIRTVWCTTVTSSDGAESLQVNLIRR